LGSGLGLGSGLRVRLRVRVQVRFSEELVHLVRARAGGQG